MANPNLPVKPPKEKAGKFRTLLCHVRNTRLATLHSSSICRAIANAIYIYNEAQDLYIREDGIKRAWELIIIDKEQLQQVLVSLSGKQSSKITRELEMEYICFLLIE